MNIFKDHFQPNTSPDPQERIGLVFLFFRHEMVLRSAVSHLGWGFFFFFLTLMPAMYPRSITSGLWEWLTRHRVFYAPQMTPKCSKCSENPEHFKSKVPFTTLLQFLFNFSLAIYRVFVFVYFLF